MDGISYLLLGILILALIIGGPLLRSRLRASAARTGEKAGRRFAAAQLTKTLDELGTTLVIQAPESVAREIVADAAARKRTRFTPRDDGRYGIRFLEPDDTIVRLVVDPAGTRVEIERFREYMGFPQTAPLWKELRSRIATAAGALEVSVIEGPRVEHRRGDLIDDMNAAWTTAS